MNEDHQMPEYLLARSMVLYLLQCKRGSFHEKGRLTLKA
jgi:hypothetical protein